MVYLEKLGQDVLLRISTIHGQQKCRSRFALVFDRPHIDFSMEEAYMTRFNLMFRKRRSS